MVPGLEADMFDGRIDLSQAKEEKQHNGTENNTTADSIQLDEKDNNTSKPKNVSDSSSFQLVKNSTSRPTPDDYYPTKLKRSRLSGPLQPLSDMFEHLWPVKTPGEDKNSRMHSPLAAMLTVSLFKSKEEKRAKGPQPPRESRDWKNKRIEITELIATTAELIEEGFVLHPAHYNNTVSAAAEVANREVNKTTTSDGWVDTPNIPTLDAGNVADQDIEQGSILAGRKVLVMDCEMCITSPSGTMPQIFSLTRVSVIDWDGNVVMDELVKPKNPITDYLTPYSGITAEKLANVTTTLQDVQHKLVNDILTPQTILVGHSLIADLNAVQLTHPFIIDTALLFPHPRGPPLKSSLKWLTQKYLSREIQKGHGSTGHDSVEDALACLDLVKQKCEKGKTWGTSEASGESIFKRLGRSVRPKRVKMIPGGNDEPRIGAVVDWGDPAKGYGGAAKVTIGCENDEDVVAGIKRALKGDNDDSRVPHGGVDFVFARMRELEAFRGWWNSSKTSDGDVRRENANSTTDSATLAEMVSQTVARVEDVWESLPPCTAFIVYSGSGDPRELSEMQALQQKFKEEYRVKKWDELSVHWTDVEEQKLRSAANKARMGIGFLAVK
jgi:RNA exonuclease 1